ncbi:hypothetical protein V6N13_013189 [Hibiscus sabdariffa]
MLFLHAEGRIEQFRLFHFKISGIDASRVCEWISAALCRGVKVMDLIFVPWYRNIPMLLTAVLFTCKTLVRLKLGFPFVMTVRSHVFMPSLSTLELQSIIFEDDDSVRRLLSICPILEHNVFTAKRYSMGNMPCLVTADFDISFGLLPISDESHGFVKLFEGIGNVKSLHLSIDPEALPFLSHKRFVAFQNLHHLEIDGASKKWKGKGLLEFLEFSPNLQTLVICKISNEFSFTNVPSCVVHQLKEFKVYYFDVVSSLVNMVTYILQNATVLEKLTVYVSELPNVEELNITNQLLNLPSTAAKHIC